MSYFQLHRDFLKETLLFLENILKFDVSKIIVGNSKIKAP